MKTMQDMIVAAEDHLESLRSIERTLTLSQSENESLRLEVQRLRGLMEVEFEADWSKSIQENGFTVQEKGPGRAKYNWVIGGRPTLRLETRPGDNNVAGSGNMERCDVYLSHPGGAPIMFGEGEEHWWAHSILFPQDFTHPTWHMYVVMDFHDEDNPNPPAPNPIAGQANFHVNFERQPGSDSLPGNLILRGYGGADGSQYKAVAVPGPVQRDLWYDFVYRIRWSSAPDGLFHAWVRKGNEPAARKVLTHSGPTLFPGRRAYLKLANYHTPVCNPYPACVGTHKASSVHHGRVARARIPDALGYVMDAEGNLKSRA